MIQESNRYDICEDCADASAVFDWHFVVSLCSKNKALQTLIRRFSSIYEALGLYILHIT